MHSQRKVQYCHPPASVHVVKQLLHDFKSVKKHKDFWIKMSNKYVFIRYFAIRDKSGEYMGTLEVTQDIAPIKAIEGEKRLIS
nr:PAS domain-containing protein [Thermoanaerobacter wiegelii]